MRILDEFFATVQPRHDAENSFAVNRLPVVARQYKAVFFLGKSELGLPSDVVLRDGQAVNLARHRPRVVQWSDGVSLPVAG